MASGWPVVPGDNGTAELSRLIDWLNRTEALEVAKQ